MKSACKELALNRIYMLRVPLYLLKIILCKDENGVSHSLVVRNLFLDHIVKRAVSERFVFVVFYKIGGFFQ